jgi:glycine cleavage system regulatory protein
LEDERSKIPHYLRPLPLGHSGLQITCSISELTARSARVFIRGLLSAHFRSKDDGMLSTLVMTLIGPDRPGLVELVSSRVAAEGGNWLESRLCRLGGQFAGIIRVEVASAKAAPLIQALRSLEAEGLRTVLQPENTASLPPDASRLATLDLVGQDQPGILHQISRVLAAHGVNVEELSSERVNAPMDGSMLFQARAVVHLPANVSLNKLRAEIERIAGDLMVDFTFRPVTGR